MVNQLPAFAKAMAGEAKIIVLLGPTASGKTDLGIVLAKKYNGEIVSADSRQVYKHMDIGTGKPVGEWKHPSSILPSEREGQYVVEGVAHHVMDIIEPDEDFTLAHFKKMAEEKIEDILARGKLPIIVGGTGLYIWSIVDNLDMPAVVPDLELRAELEKKSLDEQVQILTDKDPETAKKIDLKNPRRVIRALEVVILTGKSFVKQQTKSKPKYDCLQIGIERDREDLYFRINKRVDTQHVRGLLSEVESLVKQKYDWQLPSMTGIGYKQMGYYLRGEMNLEEATEILKRDTRHYAKRQLTWFKKDKRINWIKEKSEAESLVEEFIK